MRGCSSPKALGQVGEAGEQIEVPSRMPFCDKEKMVGVFALPWTPAEQYGCLLTTATAQAVSLVCQAAAGAEAGSSSGSSKEASAHVASSRAGGGEEGGSGAAAGEGEGGSTAVAAAAAASAWIANAQVSMDTRWIVCFAHVNAPPCHIFKLLLASISLQCSHCWSTATCFHGCN